MGSVNNGESINEELSDELVIIDPDYCWGQIWQLSSEQGNPIIFSYAGKDHYLNAFGEWFDPLDLANLRHPQNPYFLAYYNYLTDGEGFGIWFRKKHHANSYIVTKDAVLVDPKGDPFTSMASNKKICLTENFLQNIKQIAEPKDVRMGINSIVNAAPVNIEIDEEGFIGFGDADEGLVYINGSNNERCYVARCEVINNNVVIFDQFNDGIYWRYLIRRRISLGTDPYLVNKYNGNIWNGLEIENKNFRHPDNGEQYVKMVLGGKSDFYMLKDEYRKVDRVKRRTFVLAVAALGVAAVGSIALPYFKGIIKLGNMFRTQAPESPEPMAIAEEKAIETAAVLNKLHGGKNLYVDLKSGTLKRVKTYCYENYTIPNGNDKAKAYLSILKYLSQQKEYKDGFGKNINVDQLIKAYWVAYILCSGSNTRDLLKYELGSVLYNTALTLQSMDASFVVLKIKPEDYTGAYNKLKTDPMVSSIPPLGKKSPSGDLFSDMNEAFALGINLQGLSWNGISRKDVFDHIRIFIRNTGRI